MKSATIIIHALTLTLLTCCLPAQSADTATPTTMGRLFFTPSERATLNIVRQNSKAPDKIIQAEDIRDDTLQVEVEAAAKPAPVTVNGYISRSDGKNTVWVNNHATTEKSVVGNVSVGKLQTKNRQVQVSVSGSNKAVNLKPGQIYDPASDAVYNHLKDVPVAIENEEESGGVLDKISEKLGVDGLKKKAADLLNMLTPPLPADPPAKR